MTPKQEKAYKNSNHGGIDMPEGKSKNIIMKYRQVYQEQEGVELSFTEKKCIYPFKHLDIDLNLVEQNKDNGLYQKKQIDLSDLFGTTEVGGGGGGKKEKEIHRVWFEGIAGIGKTTFCRLIINKWAKKELWNDRFDLIIYVPLKNLTSLFLDIEDEDVSCPASYPLKEIICNNQSWLKDWYRHSLLGCSGKFSSELIDKGDKEELWDMLQSSSNKILFLLDGLDEVNPNHAAVRSFTEREDLCYLLTSRPQRKPKNIHALIDRNIENSGFTTISRNHYLGQYFTLIEKEELMDSLKNWLMRYSEMDEFTLNPLNCQLLCAAWESEGDKPEDILGANPSTTHLYDLFMTQWQRRALKRTKSLRIKMHVSLKALDQYKREQLNPLFEKWLLVLEKLAYQTLKKNNDMVVNGSDLKKLIEEAIRGEQNLNASQALRPEDVTVFLNELLALGILLRQGESEDELTDHYLFPHQTFIEYLAGTHLGKCFFGNTMDEDSFGKVKRALRKYYHHPRFRLVWPFTAGYIANICINQGSSPYKLDRWMKLLQTQVKKDLWGAGSLTQALTCLIEIRSKETKIVSNKGGASKKEYFDDPISQNLRYELMLLLWQFVKVHAEQSSLPTQEFASGVLARVWRSAYQLLTPESQKRLENEIKSNVEHKKTAISKSAIQALQALKGKAANNTPQRVGGQKTIASSEFSFEQTERTSLLRYIQTDLAEKILRGKREDKAHALDLMSSSFKYLKESDIDTLVQQYFFPCLDGKDLHIKVKAANGIIKSFTPKRKAGITMGVIVFPRGGKAEILVNQKLFDYFTSEAHSYIVEKSSRKDRMLRAELMASLSVVAQYFNKEDVLRYLELTRHAEKNGSDYRSLYVLSLIFKHLSAVSSSAIELFIEDFTALTEYLVLDFSIQYNAMKNRKMGNNEKIHQVIKYNEMASDILNTLATLSAYFNPTKLSFLIEKCLFTLLLDSSCNNNLKSMILDKLPCILQSNRLKMNHAVAEKLLSFSADRNLSIRVNAIKIHIYASSEIDTPLLNKSLISNIISLLQSPETKSKYNALNLLSHAITHYKSVDKAENTVEILIKQHVLKYITHQDSGVAEKAIDVLAVAFQHLTSEKIKRALAEQLLTLLRESEFIIKYASFKALLNAFDCLNLLPLIHDLNQQIDLSLDSNNSDTKGLGTLLWHELNQRLSKKLPREIITLSTHSVEIINDINGFLMHCDLPPLLRENANQIYDIQTGRAYKGSLVDWHRKRLQSLRPTGYDRVIKMLASSITHTSIQSSGMGLFQQPIHIDDNVDFRNFIQKFALIRPDLSAISIVKNNTGNHAYLILESLSEDWSSIVVHRAQLFNDRSHKAQRDRVEIVFENVSSDIRFLKTLRKKSYKGWQISKKTYDDFLAQIDLEKSEQDKIRYRQRGGDPKLTNGYREHNCLSWAYSVLNAVKPGLLADPDLEWSLITILNPSARLPALLGEDGQKRLAPSCSLL